VISLRKPRLERPALWRWSAGLGLALCLAGLDVWLRPAEPPSPKGAWPATATATGGALVLQAAGRIPMPAHAAAAHASTLLAMPPGHSAALLAYWFAGSRESGPDVQIASSQFDRATQQWSAATYVVNRHRAGLELGFGLRRLGNPVAWRDTQGRIHLFVVATGLGGWAAGRILHLRQDGPQEPFQSLRVLPLSWLWNTSHLVRAMPLQLADGGMVLPVYFELGVKYPLALRFDADGEFRGMVRMSRHRDLLQPTLLMRSETQWLALMRDNRPQRLLRAAQTDDGGVHWQDLPDPGLANPDASVVGMSLQPGVMMLAHNPRAESRAQLVLSQSGDGVHWTQVELLAQGGERSEHSYPSMAWADGSLWVSYTEERRAIAWQRFIFVPPAR
jgi:predicted neuraminidase